MLIKVDKGEMKNPPKPSEWVDELKPVIWSLSCSLHVERVQTHTYTHTYTYALEKLAKQTALMIFVLILMAAFFFAALHNLK